MSFNARYAGRCAAGDRIEPNDWVTYVGDELMHVSCTNKVVADEVASPTCPTCFLILPVSGVCEECE